MSRFDYVAYDATAQAKQAECKKAAQRVEAAIIALNEAIDDFEAVIIEDVPYCGGSCAKSYAIDELREVYSGDDPMKSLEQAYAWCGKGIRDDQIARNKGAPLQEQRGNE